MTLASFEQWLVTKNIKLGAPPTPEIARCA
jgi:hypothetical protein